MQFLSAQFFAKCGSQTADTECRKADTVQEHPEGYERWLQNHQQRIWDD